MSKLKYCKACGVPLDEEHESRYCDVCDPDSQQNDLENYLDYDAALNEHWLSTDMDPNWKPEWAHEDGIVEPTYAKR